MRFAAAAIGNEEMACPAADREISNYDREISNYDREITNYDREITNYDREITNQIVVDWGNHNVDDVRKIKLSLDNGLSSVD